MLVLFALITLMLLSGCSCVTEMDLADLKKPNAIVRQEAIERIASREGLEIPFIDRFLSRRNEQRAVRILVKLFQSCRKCKDTQLNVLSALGRLAEFTEVPVGLLIESLKYEDAEIRAGAIQTLAKARHKEALSALIEILGDDRDRYSVIWALGEIGDAKAVSRLNRLLASSDKYTRYNAYQALDRIGASEREKTPAGSRKSVSVALGKTTFKKYKAAMAKLFKTIGGFKEAWAGT